MLICITNKVQFCYHLGITDKCLQWLSSYLKGRTFRVHVNDQMSNNHSLEYGVPQGSVLGPKLFTFYMLPLSDIARRHNVNFHVYADDCQLYISFKMKICLLLHPWWNVWLRILKTGWHPIFWNLMETNQTEVDSTLSLKNHVKNTTKCCFYNLHNVFKIRRFLSEDPAKAMVHTLITSKLDYWNLILNGLPNTTLEFLVHVQKAAARLISNKTKFQHISPVLKDLHWVPIKKRIEYKILVLTFNVCTILHLCILHNRTNKGTRADNNKSSGSTKG